MSPAPELAALDVFAGHWKTTGRILPTPEHPAMELDATDSYAWLPGGHFLIHHADARLGDEEMHAIEITGYDATSGTFVLRAFDNHGGFVTSHAELRGRDWTITGDAERFAGQFSADCDRLTGRWERSEDGGTTWLPWMDITLVRQSG